MRLCVSSFVIVVAVAFLNSCAITYGNKELIKKESTQALRVGKATKGDVYEVVRQPADIIPREGGGSSWIYYYREAKSDALGYVYFLGIGTLAGGKNGVVHTGGFDFDKNQILQHKRINPSELYTSNFFSIGRSLKSEIGTSDAQKRVQTEMEHMKKSFSASKAKEYYILEQALPKKK